ncbi:MULTISPECIES: STAS domain-containing protein [Anaerotruncus]|uniref:STAS domain-containing protein n=1 Tax=Anaerotruncus TaxID=244127 RepID=UPI00082F3F3B|nr:MULTISPECIES: anti-sigma factor antagonist [Anaerotruncus]RGX51741.1 STAS domain-containing protein [Anaerotruncus sp. AF02-27]
MSVQIDIADEILIARLIGDIDHHSAKEMRETIDEAVTRAQVRELDLDFKDVTFMDSSGIGLVMGRYKLMQELGGSVHLVNIASHLKKVMVLAGLDRLAVMEKTERPKAMAKTGDNGGNDDESN